MIKALRKYIEPVSGTAKACLLREVKEIAKAQQKG